MSTVESHSEVKIKQSKEADERERENEKNSHPDLERWLSS